MNQPNQYIISFSGFSLGIHRFNYKIDDAFFACFPASEIDHADVEVLLDLEKQASMMVFNFDISGYIFCPCDRCLEEYPQKISGSKKLIVKFGEIAEEESDEIVTIARDAHQLDISNYIYEFIVLMLPLRRVHPEEADGSSSCNEDALKVLNSLTKNKDNDPRWDSLKSIKIKN